MSSAAKTTLVLGGTGKTGRRVAARLAGRGLPFRVGSRKAEIPFDSDAPATWTEALRGVRAVYVAYPPDLAMPSAAAHLGAFTEQARQCGVRRVVLLSGRGEPEVFPAEEAVRAGGLASTVLRSAFFAQNFSEGLLLDGVRSGELAFPAGNVAEPFVDADDIAEVAVAVLLDETSVHDGAIYELTGPAAVTFAEACAVLTRVSGRPVRYLPLSSAAYADALAPFLPPEEIAFFTELFAKLLDGHNAHVANGVERMLGRAPRSFALYAEAAAAAWREPLTA